MFSTQDLLCRGHGASFLLIHFPLLYYFANLACPGVLRQAITLGHSFHHQKPLKLFFKSNQGNNATTKRKELLSTAHRESTHSDQNAVTVVDCAVSTVDADVPISATTTAGFSPWQPSRAY